MRYKGVWLLYNNFIIKSNSMGRGVIKYLAYNSYRGVMYMTYFFIYLD